MRGPRQRRATAIKHAAHRPRPLLSGLLFCGCCGGFYARRGADRYACTNHVLSNDCDNARTIDRKVLQDRVLAGLRDRLMAPEAAAEAMRAYGLDAHRSRASAALTCEAEDQARCLVDRIDLQRILGPVSALLAGLHTIR